MFTLTVLVRPSCNPCTLQHVASATLACRSSSIWRLAVVMGSTKRHQGIPMPEKSFEFLAMVRRSPVPVSRPNGHANILLLPHRFAGGYHPAVLREGEPCKKTIHPFRRLSAICACGRLEMQPRCWLQKRLSAFARRLRYCRTTSPGEWPDICRRNCARSNLDPNLFE